MTFLLHREEPHPDFCRFIWTLFLKRIVGQNEPFKTRCPANWPDVGNNLVLLAYSTRGTMFEEVLNFSVAYYYVVVVVLTTVVVVVLMTLVVYRTLRRRSSLLPRYRHDDNIQLGISFLFLWRGISFLFILFNPFTVFDYEIRTSLCCQ